MKLIDSNTGIISYGAYVPRFRIRAEDIAEVYTKDANGIKEGLGITEKAVRGLDEDTATIAVNAARQSWWRLREKTNNSIGAIYVGSESHPYAVKSTAAIVGEVLGIHHAYTAADTEFACRAGTAGMQMVLGLIDSGRIDMGIAIGADAAQGAPGDILEYTAASGGVSVILGKEKVLAKIIHTTSFVSETPDFWRREHQKYPTHGGRFTGEPGYFKHITGSITEILKDTGMDIKDFDQVVFHMPNGKFPRAVAKMVGVSETQLLHSLVVDRVGNTYSACAMLGLVNALDNANPGEKILMTSYGSGAGSDSFIFEVTDNIVEYRNNFTKLEFDKDLETQLDNKVYINYGQYVRHMDKLS